MADKEKELEFIYDLDSEFVIFHLVTLIRLIDINLNALCLYMFYVKTAKLQKTNTVYATNNFCKTGLRWSKTTLANAKKILKDNGFISIKKTREGGHFGKQYVRIHYLMNDSTAGPVFGTPVKQDGCNTGRLCSDPQNAIDKKINTNDKKENTFNEKDIRDFEETEEKEDEDEDQFQLISVDSITVDESYVKQVVDYWNAKGLMKCETITDQLKKNLMKVRAVSASTVRKSIDNYATVILNPKIYWFNYNFPINNFFYNGLTDEGKELGKGYLQFTGSIENFKRPGIKTDPFSKAKNLGFLSVMFEPKSLLNKTKNTYMGVNTNTLRNKNLNMYLPTIKDHDLTGTLNFSHFIWLEECIISCIFLKKNLDILENMCYIHNRHREKFIQESRVHLRMKYGTHI